MIDYYTVLVAGLLPSRGQHVSSVCLVRDMNHSSRLWLTTPALVLIISCTNILTSAYVVPSKFLPLTQLDHPLALGDFQCDSER